MSIRKKIKPAYKDLIIRDPILKEILPESGDLKPMNSYWKRRIKDGSVVFVEEKIKTKADTKTYENKMENKHENKDLKRSNS